MFDGQYAGRRVFITGHTGFKGSWLAAWLVSLGAEVCGFSIDVPTEPSGFRELGLEGRLRHRTGDVANLDQVEEAMASFRPHIVFHMAAQALVRPSYENPLLTFRTNAMGTLNLLEAARRVPGIGAVVCITSDKCYRNDEWEWGYRETDHLGGHDPYSASKACAEIIAHSCFASFFHSGETGLATVRAGNVIGGGDWAVDRIVPDCARAFAGGASVTLRSPWATRPWQHVLEPLSGYLWLGAMLLRGDRKGLQAEAFNFGPPAEVNATVKELADALSAHWPGFAVHVDRAAAREAKECNLLKLCCDKALARLDWHAALRLEETVRLTALWYLAYYCPEERGGLSMFDFTGRQIAEYASLAAQRGLLWAR